MEPVCSISTLESFLKLIFHLGIKKKLILSSQSDYSICRQTQIFIFHSAIIDYMVSFPSNRWSFFPLPCSHQLLLHKQPAMKTLGLNSVLTLTMLFYLLIQKGGKNGAKNAQGLSGHQICFFAALCTVWERDCGRVREEASLAVGLDDRNGIRHRD